MKGQRSYTLVVLKSIPFESLGTRFFPSNMASSTTPGPTHKWRGREEGKEGGGREERREGGREREEGREGEGREEGRERGERKGGKQGGEKGEDRVEREDSKEMQPEYTKSLDYYFHRGTASSSSSAS